jgi:hypothetical protein
VPLGLIVSGLIMVEEDTVKAGFQENKGLGITMTIAAVADIRLGITMTIAAVADIRLGITMTIAAVAVAAGIHPED